MTPSPISSPLPQTPHLGIDDAQAEAARMDAKEWTPRKSTPLAVSLVLGVSASLAPVLLTALPAPYSLISSALLAGVAVGLTAHYGIKSSGTSHQE